MQHWSVTRGTPDLRLPNFDYTTSAQISTAPPLPCFPYWRDLFRKERLLNQIEGVYREVVPLSQRRSSVITQRRLRVVSWSNRAGLSGPTSVTNPPKAHLPVLELGSGFFELTSETSNGWARTHMVRRGVLQVRPSPSDSTPPHITALHVQETYDGYTFEGNDCYSQFVAKPSPLLWRFALTSYFSFCSETNLSTDFWVACEHHSLDKVVLKWQGTTFVKLMKGKEP
jgi:hypothetical protein